MLRLGYNFSIASGKIESGKLELRIKLAKTIADVLEQDRDTILDAACGMWIKYKELD